MLEIQIQKLFKKTIKISFLVSKYLVLLTNIKKK
jgi:hypothetical protein